MCSRPHVKVSPSDSPELELQMKIRYFNSVRPELWMVQNVNLPTKPLVQSVNAAPSFHLRKIHGSWTKRLYGP